MAEISKAISTGAGAKPVTGRNGAKGQNKGKPGVAKFSITELGDRKEAIENGEDPDAVDEDSKDKGEVAKGDKNVAQKEVTESRFQKMVREAPEKLAEAEARVAEQSKAAQAAAAQADQQKAMEDAAKLAALQQPKPQSSPKPSSSGAKPSSTPKKSNDDVKKLAEKQNNAIKKQNETIAKLIKDQKSGTEKKDRVDETNRSLAAKDGKAAGASAKDINNNFMALTNSVRDAAKSMNPSELAAFKEKVSSEVGTEFANKAFASLEEKTRGEERGVGNLRAESQNTGSEIAGADEGFDNSFSLPGNNGNLFASRSDSRVQDLGENRIEDTLKDIAEDTEEIAEDQTEELLAELEEPDPLEDIDFEELEEVV